MKHYLCNTCMRSVGLDELDSQGKCPYCGSLELELIEGGTPSPAKSAPRGTYMGDEDIWGQDGYWWSS